MTNSTKQPASMPDAFVILFFVMILAAIASHLVPAGSFSLTEVAAETTGATKTKGKLDPDSFQFASDSHSGVPLFAEGGGVGFFNSPLRAWFRALNGAQP